MNNINTEDIKTWSKISRNKTDNAAALEYIDIIESRILQFCDIAHALKMFSEGKVDVECFNRRMKDMIKATGLKPVKKKTCACCGRYFWTSIDSKKCCSDPCRKLINRDKKSS